MRKTDEQFDLARVTVEILDDGSVRFGLAINPLVLQELKGAELQQAESMSVGFTKIIGGALVRKMNRECGTSIEMSSWKLDRFPDQKAG